MNKSLTQKQRRLVQGVASGMTQKASALAAGYSPKNAESIACNELKKTQVRLTLAELMDKAGLSDERLLEVHDKLLGDDNPQVRAKALDLAYRLRGSFVDKQEVNITEKETRTIEVRFVSVEQERLERERLEQITDGELIGFKG